MPFGLPLLVDGRRKHERLFRRALETAKSWQRSSNQEVFLFLTHKLGGGIKRHIDDLSALVHAAGGAAIICTSGPRGTIEFHLIGDATQHIRLSQKHLTQVQFTQLTQCMNLTHVHIHSLMNFSDDLIAHLRQACKALSIQYDVTIHDYMTICPRIHLMDSSGMYCGEPDETGCNRCIIANGSPFGKVSIVDWRSKYGLVLSGARAVFAPSTDVINRYKRYAPALKLTLRPHIEGPYRKTNIALIGNLAAHKGSHVIINVANIARDVHYPVTFHIYGNTYNHFLFDTPANIRKYGAYQEHELSALLKTANIDFVWFASLIPETYSYVLSAAINEGLPCVAFDIGAIAERMSALGIGHLLPLEIVNDPHELIRQLMSFSDSTYANARQLLSDYFSVDTATSTRRFFVD